MLISYKQPTPFLEGCVFKIGAQWIANCWKKSYIRFWNLDRLIGASGGCLNQP